MHVISRKSLRKFWSRHPEAEGPLLRWTKIVESSQFDNFAELRAAFPSADKVDDWIVFNIAGNHFRLVVSIHFNRKKVYIRHVLTHAEYDQGSWKS